MEEVSAMSLLETSLFPQMMDLQRSLERVVQSALGLAGGERRSVGFPVDIYETGDAFTVRAELPGVDPKDIEVQIVGQQLSIKAQRPEPERPQGATVVRAELLAGQFLRVFDLGVPVDVDGVTARYEHGVLTVHVPKALAVRPRLIAVQAPSLPGPAQDVQHHVVEERKSA
jgi:HSP20 family protein